MYKFNESNEWNFSDMLSDYAFQFLSENYPDDDPFPMEELNDILSDKSPSELINMAFHGYQYGCNHTLSFNPNDDYFVFNGYGNLVSIPDLDEYLEDIIDESEFKSWCEDQGYFEEL